MQPKDNLAQDEGKDSSISEDIQNISEQKPAVFAESHINPEPDAPEQTQAAAQSVVEPTVHPKKEPIPGDIPQLLGGGTDKIAPTLTQNNANSPVAVVKVLSVRGVEYAMMSFALWLLAGSLIWVLLSIVNGFENYETTSFPLSLLIVSLPIFAVLFIRIRKTELLNPEFRMDPSKRRFSQITQFLAFGVCLFNITAFVNSVFEVIAGNSGTSIGKSFINLLIVLVIAGGILAYYWYDEHKINKLT